MKYLNILLILALVGSLSSCSNKKKKKVKASEETTAEAVQAEGEESDFIVDADEDDLLIEEDGAAGEEVLIADSGEEPVLEDTASASEPVMDLGETQTYQVEKGDTLMLVAFKLYGDYAKWKHLAAMNQSVSGQSLVPGTTLQYNAPAQKFVWTPQGNPYLVQRGDTLGTISDDKYGTVKRWKDIWNNNKPMIKDPNLIFAGFTLYYVPDRDIASE